MEQIFFTLLIMSAVFCATIEASPLSSEGSQNSGPEHLESCIRGVEDTLKDLAIPEVARKLELNIRKLNPSLKDLSITKLLKSEQVDKNLFKAGYVTQEIWSSADDCKKYVDSVEDILGHSDCGLELFDLAFFPDPNYHENVAKYPTLDTTTGYEQLCLMIS